MNMFKLKRILVETAYWLFSPLEEIMLFIVIIGYSILLVLAIENIPMPYQAYAGSILMIVGIILLFRMPTLIGWTIKRKHKLSVREQERNAKQATQNQLDVRNFDESYMSKIDGRNPIRNLLTVIYLAAVIFMVINLTNPYDSIVAAIAIIGAIIKSFFLPRLNAAKIFRKQI